MWTIHIALTSTFQCEYCQCSTFKRCDKSKLKSTSHGGMYSAHYFRRHQTWSTSWKSGKKRRELVIFCAWHVKQHINKYFAPFYPQALLLSFKEVEKKNMQFHSKWFRTTCYCASYLRTIKTQSSPSLLHSQVFSVVSWDWALRDDTKNGCVAD